MFRCHANIFAFDVSVGTNVEQSMLFRFRMPSRKHQLFLKKTRNISLFLNFKEEFNFRSSDLLAFKFIRLFICGTLRICSNIVTDVPLIFVLNYFLYSGLKNFMSNL